MAKVGLLSLLYPLLLSILVLNCHCLERKLHVVYMGDRSHEDESVATKHHSMLHRVLGSASAAKDSLVYSYGKSFNGFAAKLTQEEASRISDMDGVISVNPSRTYKLHTTRSWDFVNLTIDKVGAPQESDVVIGLLDTGIWPEHPSFNDTGFGPPPSKWKGTCTNTNFTCNNKIIGARYYNSENEYYQGDIPSPRDSEGHGTHTASTASGIEADASYFGLAKGVARGGVPSSRIAVYKVCWSSGCGSADILKAFDDAIADGVDIISVSLGSEWPMDYFDDPIAIGSFHAMKNGILTANSAGNSGPSPVSVANYSPWTLTVAASSIDRKFVAKMELGNGQIFTGITINTFDLNGTSYPLIWGGDAANYTIGSSPDIARLCLPGAMSSDIVSGKIVFCEALWDGSGILMANGVGTIMSDVNFVNPDVAFSWPLPTTIISPENGRAVLEYIRSTENPTATIFVTDAWKDVMAPMVASFSSRGPSPISPDILKPDITAPGVDILAGWSPLSPSSVYYGDTRSTLYNIISGTSMSCPHVSGAAAYVKAVHPNWSPAAIKSALMTTAYVMDPTKHEDLEFAYGSGQINPVAARNPGLVFDASEKDYINFLCKQGYNASTLGLVTGDNSTCAGTTPGRAWDLNYPSFSLYVLDGQQIMGTFTRTVTNVGAANSTYKATSYVPELIGLAIEPSVLTFSEVGQTQTFTVKVAGPAISQQPIVSGAIVWTDGSYVVRTPIVVYNYLPGAPYNLDTAAANPTLQRSSVYKKVQSIRNSQTRH
ncbi:PREDICTED: cucumisin-like [Erythranthe guttata]|uniref:cucumisin-like n=1 Tax=Erythranthe guttata TaxID=4155 RepID=UPI00064DAF9C|nr:PREDICTED: cucumisin-like [Erythranthe guttata]|eukprot:XP_012835452.1 PREDICTED: cucumisin-like [Erythranthe guttata]